MVGKAQDESVVEHYEDGRAGSLLSPYQKESETQTKRENRGNQEKNGRIQEKETGAVMATEAEKDEAAMAAQAAEDVLAADRCLTKQKFTALVSVGADDGCQSQLMRICWLQSQRFSIN
jgi:hypothetical protein